MTYHSLAARCAALLCVLAPVFPAFAADAPKKVLVVTVTTGFRHSSISTAEKILSELAAKSGAFTVDFVRQPEGLPRPPQRVRPADYKSNEAGRQEALKKYIADEKAYWSAVMPKFEAALQPLRPSNLKHYDAVIFASTTGDLPLPDKQGFVDWIASGKGFIGVHAATDTFHPSGRFEGFAPYVAMIGGAFRTHGPQVSVDCINEDPMHPACTHLPKRWTVFDEIYEFKSYERDRVHALLSLDKHPQTKVPEHTPVAWARNFGKGRVFYTSLGHREDVWDPSHDGGKGGRKNSPKVAKQFQQHLTGGILWALGLAPAEISHAK